jgi:non-heme Fe2+,alpha-ketoglutarate-dependent halogenase
MTLTADQIDRYRTQGYLAPLAALTADEAVTARHRIEAVEAQHQGQWPKAFSHKPHLLFTWLDALVRHPSILDTIEPLVGPDILCWSSRFFIKDPNDGGVVSWHQDLPYWGLEISESVVTVWLALSPATRANGVMKVIPGSHKKLVRHREAAATNLLRKGQEVAVSVDESEAVFMELGTGEMSLHHGLMFHGSEENRCTERRMGYAIRYIPTSITTLAGLPRDTATLVRGMDRCHHFDLLAPPSSDLHPAAVTLQKAVSDRSNEIRDFAVQRHLTMTEGAVA